MARYSVGAKTGAGSATLPQISLYAAASVGGTLREVGAFNTTNTTTDIRLVRLSTSQGTPGTGLTEEKYNPNSVAPSCTGFQTHTAGTPTLADLGYRASLGAAIGAGIIWTFGDSGLVILPGTLNGIGIIPADGAAGVALQAYIVWDE